jgi:hypothetical protein
MEAKSDNVSFVRWGNTGMLAAIIGLFVCGGAAAMNWHGFLESYLFGYVVWVALVLGCLGLTTLHHTVRGSWGLSVLRMFEAGSSVKMLVAFLVLMVPIFVGMDHVYHHWMHPAAGDEVLAHKAAYLNQPGFIIRTLVYFGIWIGFSAYFRRSSLRQDENKDPALGATRSSVGAIGLVLFVISCTFAVTDWVMSLDPHWFSTIFGFWFVVSQALTALSLCTVILLSHRDRAPYNRIMTKNLTKDLGNLLFMFTMLWAYISVSQFLIIWSGNLPEFITFFAQRNKSWWVYLGAFNVFFAFFVPWFSLLFPGNKAKPAVLLRIAILILAMRVLDTLWTVIPFFRLNLTWTDAAVHLFFAGVFFAIFGKETAKAALLPEHDTRLVEAAKLEASHVHA